MRPVSKRTYVLALVTLAAILFVTINIFSNVWLRTAQIDLTEGSLYTVSDGTKAVLSDIPEPITLRLFFSREAAKDYAQTTAYAGRVRDLLQEYASLSGGKVILEEIDPEPFTPAEDQAMTLGLTGVPTQSDEAVYFGLSGTNTLDGRETIAFFDPSREQFLEYDLTTLIYRLSTPEKANLGILSTIPLESGAAGPMAMMQGHNFPFVVYQQLSETFEIETVGTDASAIPDDIGTLLIVHPNDLEEKTRYAIDQFVMRGGHVVLFVDPLSEFIDAQSGGGRAPVGRYASDLERLLTDWGVNYDLTKVVVDAQRSQRVQMGTASRPEVVEYPVWLRLTPEDFNAEDPVTAELKDIVVATAGMLQPLENASTQFTALITSSNEAMLMEADSIRITPDPKDILRRFVPTGENYTLAARVTGPAKSAYPDGPPAGDDTNDDEGDPPAHIAEAKNINVIVVADTDLLSDRFWVQTQNMLGQRFIVPTADNGALALNAVENMMGSSELISLRTRARSNRPFAVVEDLRRSAEARFLAEEQNLRQNISQTEARLRELQSQGGGAQDSGQVLSSEQQAEVQRFQNQLINMRASLREVQANLRRDVEALGTRLAVINIALVPVLISFAAAGLAVVRRRRREKARGF